MTVTSYSILLLHQFVARQVTAIEYVLSFWCMRMRHTIMQLLKTAALHTVNGS